MWWISVVQLALRTKSWYFNQNGVAALGTCFQSEKDFSGEGLI
jgi:hypothetical protein